MTSPQPSSRRRVSFKSPELDHLYAKVNEELYARNIDRPFHWEEIDGTSILFVYDCVRLVRHRGETKIACEVFNAGTSRWEDAPAEIGAKLPIMWPIKKAQINTGLLSIFLSNCTIGSVLQKHVNEFYLQHPEYKIQTDLKKSLNHMCFVCERKWQHRKGRISTMNARGAIRFWWTNFVDRSVLRSLVSVVGNRSSTCVSWKDFADLSSHPLLEKIQMNLQNLGVARQGLADQPLERWACVSLEQVVPKGLEKHWNHIQNEPFTIQEALVNICNNWTLSSSDSEQVWSNYTSLKNSGDKWSIRELNMLMSVSCSFVESADVFDPTPRVDGARVKNILPYISQCVKLWRKSHPQEYQKWSRGNQHQWQSTVLQVCEYSQKNQIFTLPPTPHFEEMRCTHEKDQINNALKENGIVLQSTKRRRAM